MSKGRLWGGRFKGRLDPAIDALNRSLPFDRRLFPQDIAGSIAWARALRRAGILDAKELDAVVAGLKTVGREFAQGRFRARASFPPCREFSAAAKLTVGLHFPQRATRGERRAATRGERSSLSGRGTRAERGGWPRALPMVG